MSTVASGAAIMKMINSTSITSMNGVTLISCVSCMSRSPWSSRTLMTCSFGSLRRQGGAPAALRRMAGLAVEVAAEQAQHLGGAIGVERAVGGDRAREHVVDDDRRYGGEQAERGR